MSVLITAKIHGDVAKFQQAMAERADEFVKVAQTGKNAGAIHHRFGVGDGYILVVDEWETPQQFEAFFSDPGMGEFVASVGADPNTPPEITVTEAITSPDQF